MRTCKRCKEEKDDSQFGKLKCSKDGVNPRCRQCCCDSAKRSKKSPEAIAKKKIYVAEWQKQNREKRLDQSRSWYGRNLEKAREMSLEATRKYFNTENGRKKRNERSSKWDSKNPIKRRVHDRTMYAVKTGKLIRPIQCSKCDKKCTPHAHHEDYSKTYHVVWLCSVCHFYLHHEHKHHAERTSEKTPKGDAMFRPQEETLGGAQK